MTNHPTPQQVLEDYGGLLRTLVVALMEGTHHAQSYADWQDERVDRTLAPALVRKQAKRYLVRVSDPESGLEISDEEIEFETEFLSNLGVAVAQGGVRIKLLKSDNGNLPVPGPSKKRREFYAQQGELFPAAREAADAARPQAIANLVMHWVVNDEYNLIRVHLALPTAGGNTRASVESAWDEVIWRREAPNARHSVQREAELEELDIHLDDAEEDTGTEG
jgi:hypothetical protein